LRLTTAIGIALCGCRLPGQTAVSVSAPSFDTASIKPTDPSRNLGVLAGTSGFSPTRHRYVGSLQTFIKQAYAVQDAQISGGPKWIDSEIFEINATSTPVSPDQLNLMLQALLANRFKLALRRATKQLPVYDLIPAKDGPNLQPADDAGDSEGRGFLRGAMEASALARRLTSILGRPVLDDTGLKGAWRIALTWTADDPTSAATDNSGPSIFTAIQEQLGLRLKASRGPVQVLVIEHAEKPSEN